MWWLVMRLHHLSHLSHLSHLRAVAMEGAVTTAVAVAKAVALAIAVAVSLAIAIASEGTAEDGLDSAELALSMVGQGHLVKLLAGGEVQLPPEQAPVRRG